MNETTDLEVVEVGALESIERAQIDMQISTARKYPRQLSVVKQNMLSFACLDQETAEGCFYSLPRGDKNIQGPSVRLAEIAVACYGNIKAGSRILQTVTTGPNPHVVIQAVAHDLQNNVSVSIEKRRRIVGKKDYKNGGHLPPSEDDVNLAANAGSAIAFRDAVFKVIPMALIKPVFEAARSVAIGDAKTLVDRSAKAIEAFTKMGVKKEQILVMLGKKAVEDIDLGDLETLTGIRTAIKDGEITIEEAFVKKAEVKEPAIPTAPTPQPTPMAAAKLKKAIVKTEPAKEPVQSDNKLTVLRSLMETGGVSEPSLIAMGHDVGLIDEDLNTLDEIFLAKPATIDQIITSFDKIKDALT